MSDLLDQLGKAPPGVLAVIAALAGAIGAVTAALISGVVSKYIVTPLLSARDKQDREAEWRKHAIELTKLDLERKLKSGRDFFKYPLRPAILDFLANYRDLQELGSRSTKELYGIILRDRTVRATQTDQGPISELHVPGENDG